MKIIDIAHEHLSIFDLQDMVKSLSVAAGHEVDLVAIAGPRTVRAIHPLIESFFPDGPVTFRGVGSLEIVHDMYVPEGDLYFYMRPTAPGGTQSLESLYGQLKIVPKISNINITTPL